MISKYRNWRNRDETQDWQGGFGIAEARNGVFSKLSISKQATRLALLALLLGSAAWALTSHNQHSHNSGAANHNSQRSESAQQQIRAADSARALERAVESAMQEARRIAPQIEGLAAANIMASSIMPSSDLWWPSNFNFSDLRPVQVLKKIAVGPGDTLMQLLTDAGAQPDESQRAIEALGRKFNPRRLQVGQEITLTFERLGSESLRLSEMALTPSVEREVSVVRDEGGFIANEIIRSFDIVPGRIGGEISDSLYNAGLEAGLTPSLLSEFIKLFSFDVDFQREVQPGDSFMVYFERHLDDQGRLAKTGRIISAALTLSGRELRYYNYRPSDGGEEDYFNTQGQSVKKALLRTPIDGARLTSGFGRRKHPILGYSLMHKGVDFGAATGTPIQAAGEGTVELAGWNGAYGNYVRIRHGNGYATAYAHMSRIGVKNGQRVRQGQIIGAVGTTGRSTGPHLHYEVMVQGQQVNPMNVRFPSGRKLEGKELAKFRQHIELMDTEIRKTPELLALGGGAGSSAGGSTGSSGASNN
ncbi:M23 family metallopeptidase [Ferrovibrio sp.]|uniref:M23 family metallopeptidase n=1 Tax=Ferrovibrio sp. TaxID=1917215 RepID=UPI0035B49269